MKYFYKLFCLVLIVCIFSACSLYEMQEDKKHLFIQDKNMKKGGITLLLLQKRENEFTTKLKSIVIPAFINDMNYYYGNYPLTIYKDLKDDKNGSFDEIETKLKNNFTLTTDDIHALQKKYNKTRYLLIGLIGNHSVKYYTEDGIPDYTSDKTVYYTEHRSEISVHIDELLVDIENNTIINKRRDKASDYNSNRTRDDCVDDNILLDLVCHAGVPTNSTQVVSNVVDGIFNILTGNPGGYPKPPKPDGLDAKIAMQFSKILVENYRAGNPFL